MLQYLFSRIVAYIYVIISSIDEDWTNIEEDSISNIEEDLINSA